MTRFGSLLVLLAAGCAASVDEPPAAEPPKRGLQLRAELAGPKVLLAGQTPELKLTLVNASATDYYRVVKAGDGSEEGWREPHVYWTGTIDRGDGKPVSLPADDKGRCKLFDADWDKDTVQLEPGGELPVEWHSPQLEFQLAGKVRLQARYEYNAGRGPQSRTRWDPPYPRLMQGVEPFVVVSNPIEVEIVRPLDLQLRVKAVVKIDRPVRLSDLLELKLTNCSTTPAEYGSRNSGHWGQVYFDVDRGYYGNTPERVEFDDSPGPRPPLDPGDSLSLLHTKGDGKPRDETWKPNWEGVMKFRAVYVAVLNDEHTELKSDWVEVRVVK